MGDFQAVVLAAGKGTRLKSDRAKVLHEVLGRPMIAHVVEAVLDAGAERVVVVTGYQRDKVETWLTDHYPDAPLTFAVQEEQLGTAHAVWSAETYLRDGPEQTLIQYGDTPLMDGETLGEFAHAVSRSAAPLGLMTAEPEDPTGYGRIVRNDDGAILGVVEEADATPSQRDIGEINAGFYFAQTDFLVDHLPSICAGAAETAQGEYYLTDLVERAVDHQTVRGWASPDPERIRGVNTRIDLADATDVLQRRLNRAWMREGVTMVDPDRTYVEPTVDLAPDVTLYPGVHLRGETSVGRGTIIENGTVIRDCQLAEDVHIKPNCFLEDASVDAETNVGPSAHLRPGADIGRGCKVGNYVEVKKARLEDGVKAGHLTYLGDAHIGERANIGAGTITCNYDGEEKHQTQIGADAFIGSNSSLVAPVEVGDHAYVGAGSTITEDVPSGALGVGRGRQRNIDDWADDPDGGS